MEEVTARLRLTQSVKTEEASILLDAFHRGGALLHGRRQHQHQSTPSVAALLRHLGELERTARSLQRPPAENVQKDIVDC
jgi:hypothetical protein